MRQFAAASRALRSLGNPACFFVLALVLFTDWISLPNNPGARSSLSPRPPVRGSAHGRPVPVELYRTPSGLKAELYGMDAPPATWERVEGFSLFTDKLRRSGMWGITHEVQVLSVLNPADLTPVELAQMPAVVLSAIDRSGDREVFVANGTVELLQSPSLTAARDLPQGYIHNAFAVSIGTLVLLSAALNCRRVFREAAVRGRKARGECLSCGYSLASSSTRECPECGTPRA
jgi:hypothetical protein